MDLSDLTVKDEARDSLIGNPARLSIVFHLARASHIEYPKLMELTRLSSGNITTHLQKLARAGYVLQKKSFSGKKPRTTLFLTEKGREAYLRWGWNVVAALPDEVRDNLRRQVVHQLKPRTIQYNLIWDQDLQPRLALRGGEWGARTLPPLPGSVYFC